MPTLVISIDGAVIKEVQLAKERTTLGRRPYNDIVIDNLAVSGEHAVLSIVDGTVTIEDLRSTNGTYVNGQPILRQTLNHGDLLDIGKYKIRFVQQQVSASSRSALAAIAAAVEATRPAPLAEDLPSQFSTQTPSGFDHTLPPSMAGLATRQAAIRMLNGNAAGREVPLVKVVTTLGKPGVAVASITQKHHGFVLAQLEGDALSLKLNGQEIGRRAMPLQHGDTVELAGTQMQFLVA
ncbi:MULTISPECIES: FHA domain-containing protein [unclassified Delftia]|uniref:FHA domain-containing protein n=1 Tax=unclassified Delftia TaxID=2613839 RepID=UPI00114E607A|nr:MULTISPECIES: FHA domain-containing protein [unclassified Delftia]MCB4788976.1 FHA domain-containing protein [Delftia sp. Lp-1]TQL84182.1 FHA domain-containing protein [Delftia sp. HK171]